MDSKPTRKEASAYLMFMGLGLSASTELVVSGFLGWWAGTKLDARWGTKPWVTVGLIVLLLVMSFVHIYMGLMRVQRRLDAQSEKDARNPENKA